MQVDIQSTPEMFVSTRHASGAGTAVEGVGISNYKA